MGGDKLITLDIHYEDGQRLSECHPLPLLVGRGADCGLRLRHWRIAKKHFLLRRGIDGIYVEDLGSLSGTRVNGRRITRYGPVQSSDACIAGPCKMHILEFVSESKLQDSVVVSKSNPAELPINSFAYQDMTSANSENNFSIEFVSRLADQREENSDVDKRFISIRQSLHVALIQALDLRRHDVSALSDKALRQEAEKCVAELIKTYPEIDSDSGKQELINLVSAEAVGLGVLEPLLEDASITEIMVNRFDLIFIERFGKLQRHQVVFSSEMAVRSVIDRIVFPLGRRIDESSPMVDARLKDGSRLNAVIAPVSIHGSCLTIRKFAKSRIRIDDLIKFGSIDSFVADMLSCCIELRLNMIVSGGTGSGKTTLLNILGQLISPEQRIVTIEDSAELQISHPHVVSLESRPVNAEGSGQISIRDLVRNAMRMRPDRIIVGEVRGSEALDMLVAMNTGHEGSLTTLHANSPRDAISRIETLVLMGGVGLSLQAIREQIAGAVDLIIQQSRLPCGRRVVTSIAEISGVESGVVQLQTLLHFDKKSKTFVRNALPPVFFDQIDSLSDPFVQRWFSTQ